MIAPTVTTTFESLPTDSKKRHEAVIEFLGQHIFSIRNQIVETVRRNLAAFAESRERPPGRLRWQAYDAVANLQPEGREAAVQLSQKAIDLFLRGLLALFTHNGLSTDLSAGESHAISYKLLLQFIDKDSLEVVEEHQVNNDGEKVFGEYYGRWLNRYGKHR
jgi:hypothetical protein